MFKLSLPLFVSLYFFANFLYSTALILILAEFCNVSKCHIVNDVQLNISWVNLQDFAIVKIIGQFFDVDRYTILSSLRLSLFPD